MANYLWINPVAEKMYGDQLIEVQQKLEELGYIIVGCDPQLEYVRQQYRAAVKDTDKTVLDCRCPESIKLLKCHGLVDNFEVPKIEPILVRTARVLYERYGREDNSRLIITCPCTQLRDYTAQCFTDMPNIECYSWKEFIEEQGMKTLGFVDQSPIPLGFFDDDKAFARVLKLSEKKEILSGIKRVIGEEKRYDIVELLYCKDGCNNGNGI